MAGAALHTRRGTPTPATASPVCMSPTSKVGQRLRVTREPGPARAPPQRPLWKRRGEMLSSTSTWRMLGCEPPKLWARGKSHICSHSTATLPLAWAPVLNFHRTDLLTEFLSRSRVLPRAPVAGLQGDGCSENSPAGQLVPWPTLLRVTAKPPTVPQGVPVEGEDPTGPGGKAPAEECWPLGSSWRGSSCPDQGSGGDGPESVSSRGLLSGVPKGRP